VKIAAELREVRQLSHIANSWRHDFLGVLANKRVQGAIGPESEKLIRLARGAGILAIDKRGTTFSKVYSKPVRSGVYLVPLTERHSPDISLSLGDKGGSYPIGWLLREDNGTGFTPAIHISNDVEPNLSAIGFRPDFKTNVFDRAAIMGHELFHAYQFFNRSNADTDSEKCVVRTEAPAYELQFRLLDACYNGLLSEVVRKNIDTYDPSEPCFLGQADPHAIDIINGDTGVTTEALILHMVHMKYGYDTARAATPPPDLKSFYIRQYGDGNSINDIE
jgi:hypothetical protein